MHRFFSSLLFFSLVVGMAQRELNVPEVQYGPQEINANWVSHPEASSGADQVLLFRRIFPMDDVLGDFIINISADNHYFLYVNGTLVTHGPQLGDIRHWKYETLNLKDYLQKGDNVIAVKVVNFGKRRFFGFQSIHTTLMVNGITENAKIISTKGHGDGWKCTLDPSYRAIEVQWRGPGKNTIIGGFYANNPTDFVDMNKYHTNWEQLDFEHGDWQDTEFFEGARSMGGSMAYILEPRNLPLLTWEEEPIEKIARSENLEKTNFPVSGSLVVSTNQKVTFLLDQKVVTNGFPELVFSGGKDAVIRIKYAENLFGENNVKGDRNRLEGKELIGYYDHIVSNGKESQKFVPNWMRTFRFIQFEIETMEEDLVLHRFVNHRSRTNIPSTAQFTSDNETYNKIFEICKRTVDICTQDYFLSDAYYETMQYVGDTKVHALVWQAMSGDLAHTENALRQFHHSRDAHGNLLGAYPLRSTFIFPTYSLIWVDMIADHYDLTGDKGIIEQYKAGIIHTLGGFEKNMKPNHLVKATPYSYFVDWYTNPENGGGTARKNGGEDSAVVSLHFAHALASASRLFRAIGEDHYVHMYWDRAQQIKKAVGELCFDDSRQLFAENPDKDLYDQHTNIMAVLTDVLPSGEQQGLLIKTLREPDLIPATYYYRYYLFKAIQKVGAPALFDLAQKPWEDMVANNMTTTLERFESPVKPTRSEVHPWSASPAYFYFHYLAGIQSESDSYKKIRIAPVFGVLTSMKGLMPTPRGAIAFTLQKKGARLKAEITLPDKMEGTLLWNGSKKPLAPGKHAYYLH